MLSMNPQNSLLMMIYPSYSSHRLAKQKPEFAMLLVQILYAYASDLQVQADLGKSSHSL